MSLITRRSILRGLFAAPAVVAIGSLMPIRGIIMAQPLHVWGALDTIPPYLIQWSDGTISTIWLDGTISTINGGRK